MPISSARLIFFAFHVLFLVNSEVRQLRNPEQYHPGYYIHPYYEPVEALVSAKNISSETADTLVIVHSAIDNYERRKLIRETYASVHERYMHNFDILFVLGTDHFGSIPTKVLKEAEKHGDMLIGDFVDVYHNTTVKMLFWMRAMAKDYLFTVRYLHTDDDVILDMKSILNFYNDPDIQVGPATNAVHCLAESYHNAVVKRNETSKWYVSEKTYPRKYYPDYCAGAAYVFPGEILPDLLQALPSHEYISIDDALLTGIARERANLSIMQIEPRGLLRCTAHMLTLGELKRQTLVECTNTTLKCMQLAWELMEILHDAGNVSAINARPLKLQLVEVDGLDIMQIDILNPGVKEIYLVSALFLVLLLLLWRPCRFWLWRIFCDYAYVNRCYARLKDHRDAIRKLRQRGEYRDTLLAVPNGFLREKP